MMLRRFYITENVNGARYFDFVKSILLTISWQLPQTSRSARRIECSRRTFPLGTVPGQQHLHRLQGKHDVCMAMQGMKLWCMCEARKTQTKPSIKSH